MIDDPVLPAATHLTGPGASDVLAPALALISRRVSWCRVSQVQYRPGSDLVVRYRVGISGREPDASMTVFAGTTAHGMQGGVLPVAAETADGQTLSVGVWAWPFDPGLPGLADAVTDTAVADWLDGWTSGVPRLSVVAHRPTERAVVRATPSHGPPLYIKVVPPLLTAGLVERHRSLRAAGLPVPRVVRHDTERGLIAMEELAGPTLRDLVKSATTPWPDPQVFGSLRTTLARAVLPDATAARTRTGDAPAHAAMLATVLPTARDRLARLADRFEEARAQAEQRRGPIVHGDLHEGQLVIDGGQVSGLLDVDDAGPGDPVDDVATLLAHLTFRSLTDPSLRAPLQDYVSRLRADAARCMPADALDTVTAAVLVGLATGPFRIQQHEWQTTSTNVIDHVEHLLGLESDGLVPRANR